MTTTRRLAGSPLPDRGVRDGRRESTIRPDSLVWVVVGDRSKIEAPIRQLGLGEVKFLDADGNPDITAVYCASPGTFRESRARMLRRC